jgi:hypothetical protein
MSENRNKEAKETSMTAISYRSPKTLARAGALLTDP